MTRFFRSIVGFLGIFIAAFGDAAAQGSQRLPSPLGLGDVVRIASERSDEIEAADARTAAANAPPAANV